MKRFIIVELEDNTTGAETVFDKVQQAIDAVVDIAPLASYTTFGAKDGSVAAKFLTAYCKLWENSFSDEVTLKAVMIEMSNN